MEEDDTFSGASIRKALVISVSDYTTSLQGLDFCKNDGKDTYELLKSLDYQITDNHKLIGHVGYESMREAIIDFFTDVDTKAEDTLLFYYSGHGIPDVDGDIYLASSEIDPDAPFRKGFSFNELTKMIQRSVSIRIVTVLDCCYSGAAKISKGHEEDAAKLGTSTIDNKANVLEQGEGKCLLAASQAAQEAYALKEGDHSIFTYYLLQGLRGNEKSVDSDGNITPYSLGNYIYRSILNLPARKRPKQKPITKVEASGDIILASYPNLIKSKAAITSLLTSSSQTQPSTQQPQTESLPSSKLEASSNVSSSPTLPSRSPINRDTPSSSSSSIRGEQEEQKQEEQHYTPPSTITEKRSWVSSKTLIPLIGVVVAVIAVVSIMAFNLLGGGGGGNQPNTPPIANAGESKTVNSSDTVTLDGSKSTDPDGSIASYLWKQVAGPPVTLNGPNTVSPSFTSPNVTSDTKLTFDLTTKDNKGAAASKPAAVDITVKPVRPAIKQPSTALAPTPPIRTAQPTVADHAPVVNNQSVVTSMNKAITITLTANDQDLNDKLTAVLVSKPSHGTVGNIDQNTGNITYTPNPSFTGTDKFTYKVNDGKVDSNSVGTISITVNQLPSSSKAIVTNHPPTAGDQSVTTNKNTPVDITLGASDPDLNDTLTAQIVSQPSHGKLNEINQATGVVTYTPNPSFTGTDKFTYKVNDSKVDSNGVGTISITINDTP